MCLNTAYSVLNILISDLCLLAYLVLMMSVK